MNAQIKIKIDKRRDYIIIEKSNGNDILKGSLLFCGCCGESIGESTKTIVAPFRSDQVVKALKDKTISYAVMGGIVHETCKHTMFSFSKNWDFITLKNYLRSSKSVIVLGQPA